MFYHFSQNNIRGIFIVDNSQGHEVIIEADSEDEANLIAEQYLNFYSRCDCCGNRWYRVNEWQGKEYPCIDGYPIQRKRLQAVENPEQYDNQSQFRVVFIYHKSGKKEIWGYKKY